MHEICKMEPTPNARNVLRRKNEINQTYKISDETQMDSI